MGSWRRGEVDNGKVGNGEEGKRGGGEWRK